MFSYCTQLYCDSFKAGCVLNNMGESESPAEVLTYFQHAYLHSGYPAWPADIESTLAAVSLFVNMYFRILVTPGTHQTTFTSHQWKITLSSAFSSLTCLTRSSMESTYSLFLFRESCADNLFLIFLRIFFRFLSSSLKSSMISQVEEVASR